MAAAAGGAEIERVEHRARAGEDLDAHAVGRRRQLEAALAQAGRVGAQPIALDEHVAADQRRALQGLQLREVARQRLDGGVEPLDAGHGLDLRHLAGDLRVVERVERVLVLHLRDQQAQEAVLRAGVLARRARRGGGAGGGHARAVERIQGVGAEHGH